MTGWQVGGRQRNYRQHRKDRQQAMINTYPAQQTNQSAQPIIRASGHPAILSACHLLLCLLLAACGGATSDNGQAVGANEETAIENFLDHAPMMVENARAPSPTALPIAASRIPLPEVDPLQVVGDISIAGSSTVVGLTNRIYLRFVADGYAGFIKLEEVSTSDGFQAFCRGATDGVAATRPILQEELDSCLQMGRTPVVLPIGTDAVVVIVNQTNDFIQDVTLTELAEIFKAKRWSDVNPAWPARKIIRILPLSNADNFLFFTDVVFHGNSRLLETAPNTSFLPDQIEIVQRIQDNPDAIGLINYTTYREQSNAVQLVKLGGLQPELATMQEGTYPLYRPLLFYSAPEVLQNKLQLGSFFTFYLTYVNEEISQEGKFPLTRAEMDRSRLNLLVSTANEAFLDDLREAPEQ